MRFDLGAIAPLFLLLVIPIVYGLYGGDTWSYLLENCDKYNITITPCEVNEWKINGCIENNTGFWMCNCSDNYSINLTSASNSLGNFTIKIDYMWTTLTETQESVQYQYGGGCLPKWECKSWSACLQNGTQNRECNDIKGCSYKNKITEWRACVYTVPISKPVDKPIVNETKINATVNETAEPTENGFNYLILGIIGGVVLLGVIAFFLYRYFKRKPARNIEDRYDEEYKELVE